MIRTYVAFLLHFDLTQNEVLRLRAITSGSPATEFVWANGVLDTIAQDYHLLRFNLDEFLPAGSSIREWLNEKIDGYQRVDAHQEEWASTCEAAGPAPAWL